LLLILPKEDEAVVENQEAAPLATEEVATPAAEPTPEETPAAPAQEEATTEVSLLPLIAIVRNEPMWILLVFIYFCHLFILFLK